MAQLVSAANAAGGLAGHRIEPVWFEVDPATTSSASELGQQLCARFTEDAKVVAAAGTSLFDNGNSCLSDHGVPVFNGSTQVAYSAAELRRMPTVATFGITQRRQAVAVLGAAERQGYLQGGPKVGVVTVDMPAFRDAVGSTLHPGLRAAGAKADAADVVYSPAVERTSDLSGIATAMQSAVIRFRRAGVTHVVFLSGYAAPASC